MNKVLIVLMALLAFASADFLRTHDYWYTAQKSIVKTGAPLSDLAWNYCDLKCLYLERYYPTADFAFITFNAGTFKPNFGACYVVKTEVTGAKSYASGTLSPLTPGTIPTVERKLKITMPLALEQALNTKWSRLKEKGEVTKLLIDHISTKSYLLIGLKES